jgi:hypothetical protein
LDPCRLLHFNNFPEETLDGIIGTLVDDTLGAGSPQFLEFEETNSKMFECKSRSQNSFYFAGCFFHQENYQFYINQRKYVDNLEPVSKNIDFPTFQSIHGKLRWILQTRLDFACHIGKLAQVTSKTLDTENISLMRKTVQEAKQQPCRLNMSKIDPSTAKLVVYCDASFATNWDLPSQLRFLILLRDSFVNIFILLRDSL